VPNSRYEHVRAANGDQLSPLHRRRILAVRVKVGLFRGLRVPIRRVDQRDEWLLVLEAVELQPLV
jgi:hypothetical protein